MDENLANTANLSGKHDVIFEALCKWIVHTTLQCQRERLIAIILHTLIGNAGNSCYHSHFYYDESRNYCVPDCHTWRSYSAPVTVVLDAGIITSCCIGTLCTILVIIISILRKNIV